MKENYDKTFNKFSTKCAWFQNTILVDNNEPITILEGFKQTIGNMVGILDVRIKEVVRELNNKVDFGLEELDAILTDAQIVEDKKI